MGREMCGIVDVHTHVGRGNGVEATAEQLVESMDAAGVAESLVFAADLFGRPTEEVLREIAPFKGRLHAVASAPAGGFDLDRIRGWLADGLVHGVKVYTGYEHVFPYDERFWRLFEALAERRRPVIFHCGDTFKAVRTAKLKYAHPLHVDEVATDFPETPIVIAHMGWPWHETAAEVAFKNPNVWLDCSGFVYGDFDPGAKSRFWRVLEETSDVAGDGSKILFGSDWPISSQRGYADAAAGVAMASEPAARALFGL